MNIVSSEIRDRKMQMKDAKESRDAKEGRRAVGGPADGTAD